LSERDWIFEEVRSGIKDLVDRFMDMPYFFYSEQDMHAYLYHKLISGRLGEFLVETSTGDRTVLLHREYPTLNTYGKARGHFDLAVIDPADMSSSHWRTQVREPRYARHRLKVAVEFGLNAIGTTKLDLTHFKKDLKRLTDPENKVERGYLLFFVRRQDFLPSSGMLPMIDKLPEMLRRETEGNRDRSNNLVVVYAECLAPGQRRISVVPERHASWINEASS